MKTTEYTIGEAVVKFRAPGIQRYFLFSEDARTIEEWEEVQDFVTSCRNEAYFMSENMSNTEAGLYLRALNERRFGVYLCKDKNGESWICWSYWSEMFDDRFYVRELNDEERNQLRAACEAEQAKFSKRLRTYLKRYGLSNCHFSTYWSNR